MARPPVEKLDDAPAPAEAATLTLSGLSLTGAPAVEGAENLYVRVTLLEGEPP